MQYFCFYFKIFYTYLRYAIINFIFLFSEFNRYILCFLSIIDWLFQLFLNFQLDFRLPKVILFFVNKLAAPYQNLIYLFLSFSNATSILIYTKKNNTQKNKAQKYFRKNYTYLKAKDVESYYFYIFILIVFLLFIWYYFVFIKIPFLFNN